MKKLTTLFTTAILALAFMMAAPTAMAGKGGNDKGRGDIIAAFCKTMPVAFPNWYASLGGTQGACVSHFRKNVKE